MRLPITPDAKTHLRCGPRTRFNADQATGANAVPAKAIRSVAKSSGAINGSPVLANNARFIKMKLLPQTAPNRSSRAGASQGRAGVEGVFTGREIRIHWIQVVLIGFYLCTMLKLFGIRAAGAAALLVVAMGSGCGEGTSGVAVTEHFEAGASGHSVARLEVEGMMCAVACGSKIQKELLELDGVSNAHIDFDAERAENFVEVEFSSERVSPEAMAAKVHEIAGGIYHVNTVDVTHYALAAETP